MSSTTFYNSQNLSGIGSLGVGGFTLVAAGATVGVIGNVYASTGFWGAGNNISNVQISSGSFSGLTPGGVIYAQNGTTILSSAVGTSGQFLVSGAAGAPTWTNSPSNLSGTAVNLTAGLAQNLTGTPNIIVANISATGNISANGYTPISGGPTVGVIGNVYASTGFWGPGTGLTGTATSLSVGGTSGGLSGTPNITVGTVGGTTITASSQFTGPGTGLTGTAASLTAGLAQNLTGAPNITVGTIAASGAVAAGGYTSISGGPTVGVTGNIYASTGFWGAGNNITNVQVSKSFSGLTPWGVIYADSGTSILSSAAGTSGQIFVSGGASAPTWSSAITSNITAAVANVTTLNVSSIATSATQTANYIMGTTGTKVQWVPWSNAAGVLNFTSNITSTGGAAKNLTSYTDFSGTTSLVRTAAITAGGVFSLTLATFSPTLTATTTPAGTINWDVPVTAFNVQVTNPSDFTSQYIDAVTAIAQNSGDVYATLGGYSAQSKSATPAGGVSWTQAFNTSGSSYIRSSTTNASGGTAQGTVTFQSQPGSSVYGTTAQFTVNWNTPAQIVTLNVPTGSTFLQTYPSATFSTQVTGVSNTNPTYTYPGSLNGTVSGTPSGNPATGTFNFATALNKTNASGTTTQLQVTAKVYRYAGIGSGGAAYEITLGPTSSAIISASVTFTYPSFWIFTSSTSAAPTNATIVSGTAYASGVTTLGDQVRVFSSLVNNPSASPQAFWFGVRTSATQPTSFQTGPSSSLLSPVSYTSGSASLQPTPLPSGQTSEGFSLYGITLQPGNTYVSIS